MPRKGQYLFTCEGDGSAEKQGGVCGINPPPTANRLAETRIKVAKGRVVKPISIILIGGSLWA